MAAKVGTTRTSRLTPVDGDFQQQYLAAEKAYGTGNFEAAQSICESLLRQLELRRRGSEQKTMLAWRAFVALLMGHIQLYGMNDIEQAHYHYSLVLDSQPQNTLKELAEQGLEHCQDKSQLEHAEVEETPKKPVAKKPTEQKQVSLTTKLKEHMPELICDPFLSPNTTIIGVIKEDKKAQLDQQISAQQPLTLNNKLSEPLPDLIRDPFLITTAQSAKAIDQSTTKSKLESALIEDKGELLQPSKEPSYKENAELEENDYPKQEPIATTPALKLQPELDQETQTEVRKELELSPIKKTRQNTERQAGISLQAISQATGNDLLKDSLLRMIMPSIAGLTKQEISPLKPKKQASTTLKARLKNFWLALRRR